MKTVLSRATLLKWPLNNVTAFKCMSQYGPQFVEPVFKKPDQTKLYETGEIQLYKHVPIKATKNDQTTSVFYDETVRKFTNYVMEGGNKVLARQLVENTFEKIKRVQIERYHKASEADREKIVLNPAEIFHRAVENCRPLLKLTPIRRGGATYQVPMPITEKNSYFISMKWLIEAAKEKERKVRFYDNLAYELINAAAGTGRVIKKKQDLHKQCEANRAYAHYRWG